MNWVELFASTSYEYPIEVEPGSSFVGGVGYPDGLVRQVEHKYPQRFILQRMLVYASDDTGRKETIRVTRIVAEMHDGEIVEIKRFAEAASEEAEVDVSRCEACGGKIVEGQHVVIDGAAYHKRCVTENEEERHGRLGSGRADAGVGIPGGGVDGDRAKHIEAEGARAPFASAPKTVTKSLYEDRGRRLACAVTIIRNGDDDFVTFTSSTRSGSAAGRWENGFFNTDVPRGCDVAYFNEKFFASNEVVKANELRLLNALYLEALEEIGRE